MLALVRLQDLNVVIDRHHTPATLLSTNVYCFSIWFIVQLFGLRFCLVFVFSLSFSKLRLFVRLHNNHLMNKVKMGQNNPVFVCHMLVSLRQSSNTQHQSSWHPRTPWNKVGSLEPWWNRVGWGFGTVLVISLEFPSLWLSFYCSKVLFSFVVKLFAKLLECWAFVRDIKTCSPLAFETNQFSLV